MATKRTYTIPLRKAFQKAPKYKRSKRAITEVRIFLKKHMKTEDVNIGKHLNEEVWSRGIRNPPHHVKVDVTKDDEGKVSAELFGAPVEVKKEDKKTAKKKTSKKEAGNLAGLKAELEGKLKNQETREKIREAIDKKEAEEKKEVKGKEADKPKVEEEKTEVK